jgi:hypothetical protein
MQGGAPMTLRPTATDVTIHDVAFDMMRKGG